ncbi:glycoside hydrolase family 3 C-terminal domain-containing protein [candidate division KSB1 bacterium]|nr:glycoside hydrolase family 3 C-terminal domain-containing protein [candidate division KSB1 bacterium]
MTQTNNPVAFTGFEPGTVPTAEQIEAKAQELLAQLTLDEKIGMMDGDVAFWPGMVEMMGGGYADHPWPAGVFSRLGIPGIRFADGPRGVVLEGATTFPVSMARGAAWDVALEERIGDVIGRELRALGGTLFGGVCINLLRHPAWGRAQETFGEDPYHLGELGAALTRGVQRHVMACVKHFALNSMENARFKVNVRICPRALHEIYLAHFKRVVDEGVAAVMSAYNSVNGEWCGQNKVLLADILKKKWGFAGFVLTDFMFGMRDAEKAALAGQDLEMPFQMHYHQHLKHLIDNGQVPPERINEAVLRLLRQQLRLIRSNNYDAAQVGSKRHRTLAREAAEKSIVLLQNKGNLLPLRNLRKIAVIGRLADTPNTGDTASSSTRPAYVVTPLAGIQAAFNGQAEVLHDDSSNLEHAAATARAADAVLLVVGYTHYDEGEFLNPNAMQELAALFPVPTAEETPVAESFMQGLAGQSADAFLTGGDRDRLTLHPDDETLIQAIAAANPRTVVAVMAGSVVLMEAWREHVPAILMLWYPGMEGGHALADILLGRVNPSGKLPFVIPQRAEDLPFFDKDAVEIEYDMWHGYRKLERDGNIPAFPFGFGLSYTRYRYANLKLARNRLGPSETLSLSVDVSNTGARAGEEVVQLYVSPIGSAVERAPKELKGFTRVALQPGETRTIQLRVPISRLAYYNETMADFVVEPLEYELFVGTHSLDQHALKERFMVRSE